MSRDWTPAEIQTASEAMKAAGHMGYEEFCEEFDRVGFVVKAADGSTVQLKPQVPTEDK